MTWMEVAAKVVQGHGVASGRGGDPRYPQGTIALQIPHFAHRGLKLEGYFPGTLNLSIAPYRYILRQPARTFYQVQWSEYIPPEDFSFFDCRLIPSTSVIYSGLIYFPHPETKPEHLQPPDVLEVLTPWIPGLVYGESLLLAVNETQLELVNG